MKRPIPPGVFARPTHREQSKTARLEREYRDAAAQAERKIADGLPARIACLHAADCAEKIGDLGGFKSFEFNALAQKWRGRASEHEEK